MLQLYPNGDAILVVHHRTKPSMKCLVSSTILRVASPYFESLFGSNFKEGAAVRQGECPEITLQEDDPEAMEIILSILHFKYSEKFSSLKPALLAAVARQSDKYSCNVALRPWISTWLSGIENVSDPKDIGLLLTAAYFFRSTESISTVSKGAVPHLNLDFDSEWSKHEMTAILPFEIKDALAGEISRVLDQIHLAIQWNERTLGSYEKSYTTDQKLCMKCGRLPSRDVRDDRCRRCSSDVIDSLCTTETRIAAYFRCLETHKLWPSVQPFKIHTVSTLEDRIKRVSEDREHRCSAGLDCPLYKVLWAMPETVSGIVADVNGISLDKLDLDVMT
ncbi:BTB domain-containing protein [Fusarium keratoplasticum]|uniref:BTB domain-containing protein n=1 Tax=Fusarium keratoplasticum TaxID=1328300 RepID=A0ACC0QIU7_9HYPO|nr:BTB domain-containing protein [Fusarium keratoplasticum]KAI8655164.1 BTB domain-containing protein [Fusarium keratoplasticum]